MFGRKQKPATTNIGCGYLLGTGMVILILLVLNNIFVRIFFGINLTEIDDRIFQAAQFALPVVMIFVQFWLYDWLTLKRR